MNFSTLGAVSQPLSDGLFIEHPHAAASLKWHALHSRNLYERFQTGNVPSALSPRHGNWFAREASLHID
jgi:hypothetical protein